MKNTFYLWYIVKLLCSFSFICTRSYIWFQPLSPMTEICSTMSSGKLIRHVWFLVRTTLTIKWVSNCGLPVDDAFYLNVSSLTAITTIYNYNVHRVTRKLYKMTMHKYLVKVMHAFGTVDVLRGRVLIFKTSVYCWGLDLETQAKIINPPWGTSVQWCEGCQW